MRSATTVDVRQLTGTPVFDVDGGADYLVRPLSDQQAVDLGCAGANVEIRGCGPAGGTIVGAITVTGRGWRRSTWGPRVRARFDTVPQPGADPIRLAGWLR